MVTVGRKRFKLMLDAAGEMDDNCMNKGFDSNVTFMLLKKVKCAHYKYNWKTGKAELVG